MTDTPSNRFALQLVTPPAAEPVTAEELRVHLRIDETGEAAEIADLKEKIAAARLDFEKATRRQLVTATWKLIVDRFPTGRDELFLPLPPLQSVTSVRYVDPSGAWATMDSDDYIVSAYRTPATIRPAYGLSWPAFRCQPDAVEVTFVCGYGLAAAVPANVKNAVKLLAGTLYTQREDHITGTIVASLPLGYSRIVAQFDPLVDFTPFAT